MLSLASERYLLYQVNFCFHIFYNYDVINFIFTASDVLSEYLKILYNYSTNESMMVGCGRKWEV